MDGSDEYARVAREAIKALTAEHGLDALDIRARVDIFPMCEHFGTGRLWKERFTIDRAQARRLATRLRKDAEALREAIAPQFKFVIGHGSPISADFICNVISRAAVLLEGSLNETDNLGSDWTREPRCELTQFVWRTIGEPHDRELSEIVAAILNLDGYTSEEQRKFRDHWCKARASGPIFPDAPGSDVKGDIDSKSVQHIPVP